MLELDAFDPVLVGHLHEDPFLKKLTFEDVKIYGTFCSTFPQESPTKMSIVVENQCNKKYKFYHNSTTHGFPPFLDVSFRLPRRMS